MSNTIKWATYENSDASKTLKQHAFRSVPFKNLDSGFDGEITQSLCGNVRVGEGDTLAEASTIEQIDDEVMNPDTACKICQRIYNQQTTTHE